MLERSEISEVMRSRKTLVLALAGGLLGLAASTMAYHYLEREETQLRDKMKDEQAQNLVAVVVAKADLPAGTIVKVDNMATRQVSRDYVYPETILPAEFDNTSGESLVKPVRKGQPLLRTYLSENGAAGLSDKVKAGRRAIAINVDEVSSLNGLILPGDQVDLMLSSRSSGLVMPLLQGVKVLATGAQLAPRAGGAQPGDDKFGLRYATLTLDVTPQEAEKLILARDNGTLSAILRMRGSDEGQVALFPLQAKDLYIPSSLQEGGGQAQTVTYFVRGQPVGVAASYQVPVGVPMPMPQSAGPVLSRNNESAPQAAKSEPARDSKPVEQDKR